MSIARSTVSDGCALNSYHYPPENELCTDAAVAAAAAEFDYKRICRNANKGKTSE